MTSCQWVVSPWILLKEICRGGSWWVLHLCWCQGSEVTTCKLIRDHEKATGTQISTCYNQGLRNSSSERTRCPSLKRCVNILCISIFSHLIRHGTSELHLREWIHQNTAEIAEVDCVMCGKLNIVLDAFCLLWSFHCVVLICQYAPAQGWLLSEYFFSAYVFFSLFMYLSLSWFAVTMLF